jgi:hypothetical protein
MSGGYPDLPGLYMTSATGLTPRAERRDYPYKLEVELTAPIGNFVFLLQYGFQPEAFTVQAKTKERLEEVIRKDGLRTHTRLRKLVLTGPEGEIERIQK